MTSYNRSRLFICSCFFPRLFICSCFFESTYCTYLLYVHTVRALLIIPASLFAHVFYIYLQYILILHTYCKCSVYCSRLFICSCFLYVSTVLCRNVFSFWELFPATTKKLTFPPLYLLMFFLHLPTVHTFSTYIVYVFCWPSCLFILLMFFCIYLLYILNTVHALLIVPASLFAHVFLNLPTVHTYSTYILYVLCWSFPPLYLLVFFISTYSTYLFYVHTVSALFIVPASLFAHVFCIYLLYYFVETCSYFEKYFLPQPKNWHNPTTVLYTKYVRKVNNCFPLGPKN